MQSHEDRLGRLVKNFGAFHAEHYTQGHDRTQRHHHFRQMIDDGQKPEYMFIACADSRVPPVRLFGLESGQAFTIKVIGGIVAPLRKGQEVSHAVGSGLAYGVKILKIPSIIVLGRTKCGGMHALVHGTDEPLIGAWVNQARAITKQLRDVPPAERADRAAIENVAWGVRNIQNYLKRVFPTPDAAHLRPSVHGLIINLECGNLHEVNPKDASLRPLTDFPARRNGHHPQAVGSMPHYNPA